MTIFQLQYTPTMQLEDEGEVDDRNEEDDHHHHSPRSHYLSRLSMYTISSSSSKHPTLTPNMYDDDDDGGDITDIGMDMARLSIEYSSEEELSDGKEGEIKGVPVGMSWDPDKETDFYSLPATSPRTRRRRSGGRPCGYDSSGNLLAMGLKEYASENEAQRTTATMRRRSWFRRTTTNCSSSPSSSSSWTKRRLAGPGPARRDRDRWDRTWEYGNNHHNEYSNLKAGEEEEVEVEEDDDEDGRSECVVITRPKGGRRALCMDLEEVKACRDLGFELDHERMMMVDTPTPTPGGMSITMPTASPIDFDTSSGGDSPIANWRISSPGDDPRDVKARLKVWAQAVAIASTSLSTLDTLARKGR
ncbi:hypothetical protein NE237_013020 [Protea cynaroides]|uniref:Uncharacterized protein n=1 Tax=Protea cynaroides TaxID=273540 RepID=A0A9Q0JYK8_9MAGN|nr:hypothetical protein NE237_013020 [Protea cynaroides]